MFDSVSITYLEKSLVAIPLNGKRPILKNWTTLTHESDELKKDYPMRNIGILTGKINKIIAIDIDKEEAKKICPPSPVIKKGAKGETRFFKYNGEPSIKRHDLGIEILSDGNQTVIPPSIHPETKQAYTWLTLDTLENFDIEDLPIIPKDFILFLNSDSSFSMSEGRHNTLVSLMGAKISDFKTKEEAVEEVYQYDLENHNPPYFYDKSEAHKGTGKEAANKMYESVKKTAIRAGTFFDPDNKIDISFLLKEKPKYQKLPKLPEGIAQDLFDDIYKNSWVPRTQFSFMAVMQIFSHVIGNKASFAGTYANLYQYAIAPSSFGKEQPFRKVQNYIRNLNSQIIASNSPTSESIVHIQLEKHRERIFMVNESDKLLKRVEDNKSNHGLKECLTDLFDHGGKILGGKEVLAGKGKQTDKYEDVFSPFVGIFLSSTVEGFNSAPTDQAFSTGLLSRFLFYFEDRYKKTPFKININEMPDDLILEKLKVIYSFGSPGIANLSNTVETYEVIASKESFEYLIEIHDEIEAFKNEKYGQSNFFGLIGRKMVFIKKFALIHHFMINGINYHNELKPKSLRWAKNTIDAIVNNMLIQLEKNTYESPFEKDCQKIVNFVEKNKGVKKREIMQRVRVKNPQNFNAYLKFLIEKNSINYDQNTKLFF